MTTIFTAAGAGEFLALVPHLLGYVPVRSVVLVPFAGARTLGAMRLDLPADRETADTERIASTFIGMVCKVSDADGVAPIVYTDAVFDGSGIPHDPLVRALLMRADLCGLRIVDALCVAANGWDSYVDPCDSPTGRPLDALRADDPRLTPLHPEGGDQRAGARLPDVESGEKEHLGSALATLDQAMALLLRETEPEDGSDGGEIDARALSAACGLDDMPLLFERALLWNAAALDPFEAAAVAWALSRPVFRDVALMQWSGDLADGDEALDAQLRWLQDGESSPEHLGERMWGLGPRPDRERLQNALGITRRLAASAPSDIRPGVLSACAWLAWALGRSTHAAVYARSALDIDSGHGLSRIVLTFVENTHLPEWTFERQDRRGRA